MEWTKESLWELRKQVSLCSVYTADFRNNMDIEEHMCQDFFDGYVDYLEELMEEKYGNEHKEDKNWVDNHYFALLDEFDTDENLLCWYYCFDEDPLPTIHQYYLVTVTETVSKTVKVFAKDTTEAEEIVEYNRTEYGEVDMDDAEVIDSTYTARKVTNENLDDYEEVE